MNSISAKLGTFSLLFLLTALTLELEAPFGVARIVSAQADKDKVRDAFLADDAGPSAFLALASYPELFEDRDVRMKLFRSLTSKDLNIFKAAVELGMKAPQMTKEPMLGRRFDLAFIGRDAQKKKAILDLAAANAQTKDLRVVGLISEALADPDPALSEAAISLVRSDKSLQELPAIAEALSRRTDFSERPSVKLPDYQVFKEKIEPLFVTTGSDQRACINCHETHPILKLLPIDSNQPAEDQMKTHYRSALRVIDLRNPEGSLLVIKPTNPSPPEGTAPSPNTHEGGARWEKGSPSYQAILQWIRTGAVAK
ncbi:MAG TPA: hypothetical protein VGQ81_16165 [Acidobacteriota bacterium]|jgi:hypothetical protein|nr:hypothetical protein [Acidobacteriota bacterium]